MVVIMRETTPEEREQMKQYGHLVAGDNAVDGLSFQHCEIAATGMKINESISFNDWQNIGTTLQNIHGSVGWWIGDWLNFGESKYGESYAQAVEATSKNYQTLANYKYVASRIEFSRRRENLSWTVHAEVAGLEPQQQEEVLSTCETSREARELVREMRGIKSQAQLPAGEFNFHDYYMKCVAAKSGSVVFEYDGRRFKLMEIREKVASENGSLINELIALFEPINPNYEQFYKVKPQREAVEWLLKKTNEEFCRYVIGEVLPKILGQRYAPTITTPVQLRNKLAELRAYVNKEENNEQVAKIW